jgi:hypothetical protein
MIIQIFKDLRNVLEKLMLAIPDRLYHSFRWLLSDQGCCFKRFFIFILSIVLRDKMWFDFLTSFKHQRLSRRTHEQPLCLHRINSDLLFYRSDFLKHFDHSKVILTTPWDFDVTRSCFIFFSIGRKDMWIELSFQFSLGNSESIGHLKKSSLRHDSRRWGGRGHVIWNPDVISLHDGWYPILVEWRVIRGMMWD